MGDLEQRLDDLWPGDGVPRWPELLGRLCALLPGSCGVLAFEDGGRAARICYAFGAEADLVERWARSAGRAHATAALRLGQPHAASVRSSGGAAHALALPLSSDGALVALVHVRRRRPHEDRDAERLRQILPTLRRAWAIESELRQLRRELDCARAALDLAPLAVLICDGSARLLHANRRGAAVLHNSDGMSVAGGRLAALRPHETSRLRSVIRAVAGGAPAKTNATFSLDRPRKRPLAVSVLPVPAQAGCALVVASDPDEEIARPDALAGMFGLTRAEARLAAALLSARTLDDCAAEFGVSVHTLRSQLRRVFHKTNTRRQPELVSVLMSALRPGRS